ncbi:thrombospondin type-1 domain-containing protein [Candidatus Woesearchaeota archaeon]|nr:thrombospondin type-1 domain-containing protein [Candidatus Woesearchaeota archaeon]
MTVMNRVWNFLFFLFFCNVGVFAFSVCNVDISEPWFQVRDSNGFDVLIVDSQGDMYFEGRDHTLNNQGAIDSFVLGSGVYFNAVTSKFSSVEEQAASLGSLPGLVVRNAGGTDLAKFTQTSILSSGKAVYEGSQGGCSADGIYCLSPVVEENRNYFCDLTAPKTGVCAYSVLSSRSCTSLDYYFCSGLTRYKKLHSCGDFQGGCYASSNLAIETCVAPANSYGVWACSSSTSRSRTNIIRSPTCSAGGCGVSSSTVTETQSCGSGMYCSGGNCNSYTYAWAAGSWSACSASCGGGSQSRAIYCRRNDGALVSDSYCSGYKPASTQSCNTQACTTYSWVSGSWGSCSVSCGGGTQTRTVGCFDSSNSLVSDSYCGGTKPATSQTCNPQSCSATCTSHASYKCTSGGIWWYDSCGVKETLKQTCFDGCDSGKTQCNFRVTYAKTYDQFWGCSWCQSYPDGGLMHSDCVSPMIDTNYNCGAGFTAQGIGYYKYSVPPQIGWVEQSIYGGGNCASHVPATDRIHYVWLCRSTI